MMPVSTATQHTRGCAEGRSHSEGLTHTCEEREQQRRWRGVLHGVTARGGQGNRFSKSHRHGVLGFL